MRHDELVREITGLAEDLGCWWHYCCDSRCCAGHPGLPDLLIIGWRGGMLSEVKAGPDRRSRAQLAWGQRLRRAGLRYEVWTEADWAAGTVRAQLREIA